MYSIAIDGPVSSGKSTLASEVSKKLNILHLNTGALYRAIGLYAYRHNIAQELDKNGIAQLNEKEMSELIDKVHIDVKFVDGKQHTYLNGEDVTAELHTPIMSDYSSRVSAIKSVRNHILELQRNIAKKQNVVMEGRDITSHVLPKSKYKFYITASPEIRAERRMKEENEKGNKISFEQMLQDVKTRDFRDSTRDICPLIIVPDAVVIDTTKMTLSQTVDKVLSYIKE